MYSMVRYAPYVNRALYRTAVPAARAAWNVGRRYASQITAAASIGKAIGSKIASLSRSRSRGRSLVRSSPSRTRSGKSYQSSTKGSGPLPRSRYRKVTRRTLLPPAKADGHMETSRFLLVRTPNPVKGTGKNEFTYQHSHQEIIEGVMGRQSVNELFKLGTYAQVIEEGNNVNRAEENRLGYCMFNQIPTQAASMPLTHTSTGNMVKFSEETLMKAPQKQLVWESVSVTQTIGNLTNVPVQVVIYWCKARSDTEISPSQWWTKCENDQNVATSNSDAPTVTTDLQVIPGALGNATDLFGKSPKNAKGFGKRWTIIKQSYITLQPGVQHKLNYKYVVNKKFTYMDVKQSYQEGNLYIGGVTVVPLIVTRGSMVTISDTEGGNTVKNVTYSKTQIGVITQMLFRLREMKELPRIRSTVMFRGIVESGNQAEKMIDNQDEIDDVKTT